MYLKNYRIVKSYLFQRGLFLSARSSLFQTFIRRTRVEVRSENRRARARRGSKKENTKYHVTSLKLKCPVRMSLIVRYLFYVVRYVTLYVPLHYQNPSPGHIPLEEP